MLRAHSVDAGGHDTSPHVHNNKRKIHLLSNIHPILPNERCKVALCNKCFDPYHNS